MTTTAGTSEPADSLVTPLLTDTYQLTMAYAYWKSGMHELPSVFDLFFRENPFSGEYTVFSGLDQVIALLNTYKVRAATTHGCGASLSGACELRTSETSSVLSWKTRKDTVWESSPLCVSVSLFLSDIAA